jgi:FAD/FMN-containing dehydrogenase/Fe-S oxidoreductase
MQRDAAMTSIDTRGGATTGNPALLAGATDALDQKALGARLRQAIRGEVLLDPFSRGRYATDASIYQIVPLGVVVPRRREDVRAALQIAREHGVPVLARGGGTSQSGQTVGRALVIDYSKHLRSLLAFDPATQTCEVEPGIVLDDLNRQRARHGLWFPVDVSTKSRATIGGMAGNNSCGTRSIRYGVMRDNVVAIDALLADGSPVHFSTMEEALPAGPGGQLKQELLALGRREQDHLKDAFPRTARRVGGYNLDALLPANAPVNLATLLVGSEGTLALSERLTLKLARLPRERALGICHFATFRSAMEAAQHIVKLGPVAVEVVDRTLIELARENALFQPVMQTFVKGEPDALLLTEFAEDDQDENVRRLDRLEELMGDLGHPDAVVKVTGAADQRSIWEVREAGLNIMMSMKSDGKPVSFIEDCAVPLEHLADYTERLTEVFARHGTRGTWYAHASVGCLHVRPILNLKLEKDAATMRTIAEEAFAMVKQYKGAHSGEHGDGIVRSEFHAMMFGERTVRLFEQVKRRFDPRGVMNPGKIVDAPRMNDRSLFRYAPGYGVKDFKPALEWPGYTGAAGGLQGAIEMCNNNGACRKFDAGVMCPSYRVTRNERDVTRGRANSLRLALSGQLGAEALASDAMLETLQLCVSCKGCKRECPTGVDMARMKIEVLAARAATRGVGLRDRLVAYLPRYAPYARHLAPLLSLREAIPGLARLIEKATGLAAARPLPRWSRVPFAAGGDDTHAPAREGSDLPYSVFLVDQPLDAGRPRVALFADTFNTYFEPENLAAARSLLGRLGYGITVPRTRSGGRPLCCGRTFLAAGLVEEARLEARRLLDAVLPLVKQGIPLVGIEPSCLLTLRDETLVLRLGPDAERVAESAMMLEEFLVREAASGRIKPPIARLDRTVHVHGHCHQKALGAFGAVGKALALVEGLKVKPIQSSCCGMAGAFGYAADTYAVSRAMAEADLLPAIRKAAAGDIIAADGFSCRHQISDLGGSRALHVARILEQAMGGGDAA